MIALFGSISGALFDSTTAAGGENDDRGASSVIDRKRKKKLPFDVDLLFHQHGFDWELSNFHRQHPRRVSANIIRLVGEGHPPNASAPRSPSLNLDNDFAVLLAPGEFLGSRDGFING